MHKDIKVKIKAEHIDFYYGKRHSLKNICLDIPENNVMAIIGPSGCGKSTFIRLLNRMNELVPNTTLQGKIYLDGKDINSHDTDVVSIRRLVGMVFQKPNPFPKSIFENVSYGLKVNGIKDQDIIRNTVEKSLIQAALWDEVKDRLHDNAFRLSGGQQQRLCIARCIAVDPEVILFDEPCASLDPVSTKKIEELIMDLKENYTIVIVTHNMQQAARISDLTSFFYEGVIIETGATKKIFTNPKEKQTEDYITGRFG